jgi:hypothetical protein
MGTDVRTFFYGYLCFIATGLTACFVLGAMHR